LLKSTKIAGCPESYFRIQDREKWSAALNVGNNSNFKEFLEACLTAGQTNNGVFSSRIMWGTMDELIVDIKSEFSDINGNDRNVLTHAFGKAKFIYLKRKNYVAQAVSRLRAEQTGVWHVTNTNGPDKECLNYSASDIERFVVEGDEHNKEWAKWFSSNGIEPYGVSYEDLVENPESTIKGILSFLDLPFDDSFQLRSDNKRMSDALSQEWIDRYNDERA
jgi:LPS sulfotransferase NodH